MTYTLAQIRQAGKEGEVNHLDVEHIIDLLKEQPNAESENNDSYHVLIHKKDRVNSLLRHCLFFLNEDQMVVMRDSLIERTPKADGQKEPLYRWVRASERLPEFGERKPLRICNEYNWTGRFILSDDGHYKYCDVDGQARFMKEEEFSEIEWLCKVETPEQDEAIEEAAKYLFNLHNSYTQIDTEIGQRLLGGFRKDVKEIAKQYLLIKK